jgi:hypothetical protein
MMVSSILDAWYTMGCSTVHVSIWITDASPTECGDACEIAERAATLLRERRRIIFFQVINMFKQARGKHIDPSCSTAMLSASSI